MGQIKNIKLHIVTDLKNRLVCPRKLREFAHDKRLELLVRRKCALTKSISAILLNAYREFIELKIVVRDWDGLYILPPRPVKQVWRLHILDTKYYDAACRDLCGRLINYDPGIDVDRGDEEAIIKYTQDIYALRYNRPMQGSVWSYHHYPTWWKDYCSGEVEPKVKFVRLKVEKRTSPEEGAAASHGEFEQYLPRVVERDEKEEEDPGQEVGEEGKDPCIVTRSMRRKRKYA